MAIVTLPALGADPVTLTGPVLDGKVDPLATDYNGNIDNTNIASGAAIANSKLNLASIAQAVTMTGGLTVSTTALTMTSMPINEAKGADIASATTPNITSATGNTVHITGTTTITGFATGTAGIRRILIFDGILTFTHNSSSMILPTGANITTAAGDTCVVVSEGSGNWRCTSYQRKDGTSLVAFTPSTSNALSKSVVQVVNTHTGSVATGTTTLPWDDSVPAITEGDEYMTLAITPSNSSNLLNIEVIWNGASSGDDQLSVALFQDATSAGLAAVSLRTGDVAGQFPIPINYWMTAGTTSSTTFRVRAGTHGSTTVTFNGSAGGRKFAGVCASSITITEYKA